MLSSKFNEVQRNLIWRELLRKEDAGMKSGSEFHLHPATSAQRRLLFVRLFVAHTPRSGADPAEAVRGDTQRILRQRSPDACNRRCHHSLSVCDNVRARYDGTVSDWDLVVLGGRRARFRRRRGADRSATGALGEIPARAGRKVQQARDVGPRDWLDA